MTDAVDIRDLTKSFGRTRAHRLGAYGDERWWALTLPMLLVVVSVAIADWMLARRDIGSGVFATRPGTPRAAPMLGSTMGLAMRLQRTNLLSWLLVMVVLGSLFGGIVDAITQLFDQTPQMAAVLERLGGTDRVIDAYLSAITSVLALLVPPTASARRLSCGSRKLCSTLSRFWPAPSLGSNGRPSILSSRSPRQLPFSRLGQVGEAFQLHPALLNLSPYIHVPALPHERWQWFPLLALTAIAAGLTATGIPGLRRRDLSP